VNATSAARRIAILCLALAAGTSGAADVDARLQRAEQALDQGRPAEAEKLFRALIAEHPGMAEAYGGLASALNELDRAAEGAELLLDVGQGLVQAGEIEPGVAYLERAVELAPQAAAAHAALGHALLTANRFHQASTHLSQAIALGESGFAVRLFLGSALWESGQLEQAEQVYREVLAGTDGRQLARQSLGALLQWKGRFEEAASLLEAASRGNPNSVTLQFDLARSLEGAGRVDDAVAAYRRVIELEPDFAQARYRLAILLNRTGDREAARQELQRFEQLHAEEQRNTRQEGLNRARVDRGWELLRAGRAREAVDHFRNLSESVDTLHGLAAALALSGDHRAALAALERGLLLDPQRQDLRRMLMEQQLAATERR